VARRRRKDLLDPLIFQLEQIASLYSRARAGGLKQNGISEDRLRVLRLAVQGVGFAEIADELVMPPHQVTRIAQWLCREGLSRISVDTNDERRRFLRTTRKGDEAVESVNRLIKEAIMSFLPSDGRAGRMNRAMKLIEDLNVELYQPRLPGLED
jgi:DNA-binding MarR family transcriptional regulator